MEHFKPQGVSKMQRAYIATGSFLKISPNFLHSRFKNSYSRMFLFIAGNTFPYIANLHYIAVLFLSFLLCLAHLSAFSELFTRHLISGSELDC